MAARSWKGKSYIARDVRLSYRVEALEASEWNRTALFISRD